jgi:spore maturation protein CgeB
MKIIYAGVRFDEYDPSRGYSFEYRNFWKTLEAMPNVTAIEYPFDRILEVGKQRYNEELFAIIKKENPDVFFAFMHTDELDPSVLDRIAKETKTKSIAWFADDYWRFFNYSKHWPLYFSYVVTTYSKAVDWYRAAGFENVLSSQWACNTKEFMPLEAIKNIGVSFVGQKKSGREKVVGVLASAGIHVDCFGSGWPSGRPTHEEMLSIFSRSNICLNLTDRKRVWDPSVLARLALKKSVDRLVPDFHIIDNIQALQHFAIRHTHARPFELAGCGAFVISGWSEDIGNYYQEDKEMVFYRNADELVKKTAYYLSHGAEREAIAEAGYQRTIREHTYEARFKKIFSEIR